MLRNSRKVFSCFKANADSDSFPSASKLTCRHDIEGHGVFVHHFEQMFITSEDNPLLNLVRNILRPASVHEPHLYGPRHVAILVDDSGRDKGTWEVNFLQKLFKTHYQQFQVQDASQYPVTGLIIDKLENFSGLDADVIVFIGLQYVPGDSLAFVSNNKYKLFVTSRAISRLDLVFPRSDSGVMDNMQFSANMKGIEVSITVIRYKGSLYVPFFFKEIY